MKKLPVISGKRAIKIFEKVGWEVARQKRSHVILVKPGKRANLSIPLHKELDTGTLPGLIKDSGLSINDFRKLLCS